MSLGIEALISEYQGELDLLEERRKELQVRISVLEKIRDEKGKVSTPKITRTSPIVNFSKDTDDIKGKTTLPSNEDTATIGDIILKILDESPERFFSITELTEELQRHGVKSTAANFKNCVRTTATKLRLKEKVNFKIEDGNMKKYQALKGKNNIQQSFIN